MEIIINRASFPIRKSVGGAWRDLFTGETGNGEAETPSNRFRILLCN